MKTKNVRIKRWVLGLGGSALGLTAVMGLLHMPFAAPVLRIIFAGSVCPVMRGTPEQIDRAHALGAESIRKGASGVAPARPALVFALDVTKASDVAAWAKAQGVKCSAIAGNANLQRCVDVPSVAVGQSADLPMLEEVTFEFQSTGALVNVQTLRRHLEPAKAAYVVQNLETKAEQELGPPSKVGGEPTTRHLARSFLSTYVAEHTFADYRATIAATNLRETGIMVREEYLSAR